MFDIGFGELLVCAIIALLVLGPERLPGAVRTVGRWVGRARHTVNNFTDQIDREIRAEELKRRIEEEMKKVGVDDISRQVRDALHAPLQTPLIGADHLRDSVEHVATRPDQPAVPANSIAPPALQQDIDFTATTAEAQPANRPDAITPAPADTGKNA